MKTNTMSLAVSAEFESSPDCRRAMRTHLQFEANATGETIELHTWDGICLQMFEPVSE